MKLLSRYLVYYIFLNIIIVSPSCKHSHKSIHPTVTNGDNYWKKVQAIDFLVVGDWGRNGEFNQKEVANSMAATAQKHNSNFIISTGDNFYPDGVISTTDPQWHSSFEHIYTAYSLNIPWYTAFGNHDYRGSIQAQLDYSKVSRRWRTNKRYYSFEKTIPNSNEKAIFVVIDTNPFDESLSLQNHSDLGEQNKYTQLNWLDSTLQNTSAEWKIVIGHHPLFTTGVRRNKMLEIRKALQPLFEKHKVNVYFAGHEHDLQHQKPKGFTHYFVSGAGSEIRPVTWDSSQTKMALSTHGFMHVQLQKDSLKVNVVNYLNKLLYTTSINKSSTFK